MLSPAATEPLKAQAECADKGYTGLRLDPHNATRPSGVKGCTLLRHRHGAGEALPQEPTRPLLPDAAAARNLPRSNRSSRNCV